MLPNHEEAGKDTQQIERKFALGFFLQNGILIHSNYSRINNATKIRHLLEIPFALSQNHTSVSGVSSLLCLYFSSSALASFKAQATMERSSIKPGGMKSGKKSKGVTT